MPSPTDSARRLGTLVAGKWTLEALLGEGGLGAVYRAKHKNGSKVAIKILHAERADDRRWASRFEREALLANSVEHPAVVQILDDGKTDDGCPFLVSELVEGVTLEEACEEAGGTLTLGEVAEAIDVLLSVLEAAHAKGVLHGDIKPANLMRPERGGIKVLDFGLAREIGAAVVSEDGADAGAAIGTVGFMAPEQAQGRWDLVDASTDVWAVGATFLKLATGLDTHEAETPEARLTLAATRSVPSLAARTTSLPPGLAEVLDRATAFSKAERYSDAASFRRALAKATCPATERLASTPMVMAEATPRRGRLPTAIVVALLAAAAIAIALFAAGSKRPLETHAPSPTLSVASSPAPLEPSSSLTPAPPTAVSVASAAARHRGVLRAPPRGSSVAPAFSTNAGAGEPEGAPSAADPLDRRR